MLWPRSLDEIQGRHRRRPRSTSCPKRQPKQLAYSASVKNNAKCMLCWRRPKTDGLRPVTPCEKNMHMHTVCADCLLSNANRVCVFLVCSNTCKLGGISNAYIAHRVQAISTWL